MELVVQPDGGVRCVYDEAIDLSALERVQIKRGSHVEPDTDGRWFADLAVVQGPRLGPFDLRSASFAGTMGPSDSPATYASDVRQFAFSDRPSPPSAEGVAGVSRFSRMEFPRMLRVCDSAASKGNSR